MTSVLSVCAKGFEGIIQDLQGEAMVEARLMDLGIVRGEKIRIVERSLFGDFIVEVHGTKIALRKSEAGVVVV